MFDHLKTGFTLTKQSYYFLRHNNRLWIFPAISFILNAVLFAAIMIPIAKVEVISWTTHQTTTNDYIFCFTILLLFFFIAHFISMCLHGALIDCAVKQLRGEPYSVLLGFKAALSCFSELFVWNLWMTTIGIGIRFSEQFVDHWSTYKKVNEYLVGLPWLIAAMFVLPIIILEKKTTLPAIKCSAHLVASRWNGNQHLVPTANISLLVFFSTLLAFLPAVIAFILHGKIIILIGSIVTMILFACNTIFFSGTRAVFLGALYLFAKNESVPSFDCALMRKAFQSA